MPTSTPFTQICSALSAPPMCNTIRRVDHASGTVKLVR
jgi:hypothetical protein